LAVGAGIDGLALELALWCRYCEGTTEAGAAIAPNDDNHATLRQHARAAQDDPQAFLRNRAVFGDLADDARLGTAFAAQLGALRGQGVRAALRAYSLAG
ncbi:MAG: mannitol dehydrogenase family protein, partial [Paracoccus sp. (in: a-proteobacteria)]